MTADTSRVDVFRPCVGQREAAAVRKVIVSRWTGRGPLTARFEHCFANHLGRPDDEVFSVASCTDGLFLAVQALGIGCGSEIVIPSIHFVGAANAVAASGASPVFCDVDERTLNATPHAIEKVLTPRTRAVMLLHYGGVPAPVAAIADLCRARGIYLIEDAAVAVAASVGGRACGTFGDIGLWSFDSMKMLTCGDGGMVWCRDGGVLRRIRKLALLGLDEASGFQSTKPNRWWEFDVHAFGRRSILNDMAAAVGLVQMERLRGFLQRRRAIDRRYRAALTGLPNLSLPPEPAEGSIHGFGFFWIQLPPRHRDGLAAFLRQQGVYTTFRYAPLHRVAAYGHGGPPLPGAETAAGTTLLLPQHQGLRPPDIDRVAALIHAYASAEMTA